MSSEQRFDPRFNPVYQRGFDASAERARRATVTPTLTPEDVVYGRSAGPDLTPPPPPDEEAGEPVAAAVEAPSPKPDRHNPFVWVLWMLSVGLVGGGIALFMGPGRGDFAADADRGTVALIQTLYVTCPAMITVGLGTISGLLFWHAAAWKRRHR